MENEQILKAGEQRKLVLYVERDYLDGSCPDSVDMQELCNNQGYQGFRSIRESVERRFDLECMHNLDKMVLERIQTTLTRRKFNALITHLPFEEGKQVHDNLGVLYPMLYYGTIYGKSLDLLSKIKDADPDIAILVYTGMSGDFHWLPKYYGADRVIKKSGELEKDVQDVNTALDYFFETLPGIRKKRGERAIKPPEIIVSNRQTFAETTVNLNGGMGYQVYVKIVGESEGYPGNVYLVNLENGESYSCKDAFNLLGFAAFEGTRVRILADGEDPGAQRIVRRLYSAITSEEERKASFDRFD